MPLKVIIIGAGLAGLGVAIALNRQGHDIEIFEQSSFLNEVGAAIHIPPNATHILKAWGCKLEDLNPTFCRHLTVSDSNGKFMFKAADTAQLNTAFGLNDEWLLTHRVDLHNTLRKLASVEVNGKKPLIHLASKVQSVDAEAGTIVLEDGTHHTADLVVGADGMHSRSVTAVTGKPREKESTGQNTFRFLVPMEKIQANPVTKSFFEEHKLDGLHCFTSEDRRLVVYPCRDGRLLNIVALHPTSTKPDAAESSWLAGGNLPDLLDTFSTFGTELVLMCSMAEDLKLWSLASRAPPPQFYKGKLALVGDAAHPTLPHQGQGGAQSFEDGAALGELLPPETQADQVPARLDLYNKTRYKRAVTTMFMSKVRYEDRKEMMEELHQYVPDAEYPEDLFRYFWTADTVETASRLLLQEPLA